MKSIFLYLGVLFFIIPVLLSAQVVDNDLGKKFSEVFPELSEGYVDVNENGSMDQSIDLDEAIPDTNVKDSIIQVQEILDFILDTYRFISLEKLIEVKKTLDSATGTISELISLEYRNRIQEVVREKQELGEDTLYLTPQAKRDAIERMQTLITRMVHAYKKEGKQFEEQFIDARRALFSMIEKGYPFPDSLTEEDARILENSMINTLIKEQERDPEQVVTAITTIGKLKSQRAVPYLRELIDKEKYKVATIKAFGEIGTQQVLDLLSSELKKVTDRAVKKEIIQALGKIGGEAGRERVVSLFPQKDEKSIPSDIQLPALQALLSLARKGNTDSRIFTIFERYLEVEDPELKTLAVKGLSYFPGSRSGDLLTSVLHEEDNEDVLLWTVRSINKTGHTAVLTTFINMLRNQHVSETIKAEIIHALGENSDGVKAVQYIIDYLGAENPNLRRAVSEALISLYDVDPKTIAGYLSRGLRNSEDERYLTEGTEVMAGIADESTLSTLVTLLQKPFPVMKTNVTWAFYRIRGEGNPRYVEELAKLVSSETEPLSVRINAVRAIGAIGYDSPQLRIWQTLTTIAKMRGEKYSMLKYFAIEALGKLGQKPIEVVSTLTNVAVRERNVELQNAAVQAIRELSIINKNTETELSTLFRKTEDFELKVKIIETLGDMNSNVTAELAPSLLFESTLPKTKKQRILYSLSKAGTSRDYSIIMDTAEDIGMQDFIRGILESADATVVRPLIDRRIKTETNQDILSLLEEVQAVYEARF